MSVESTQAARQLISAVLRELSEYCIEIAIIEIRERDPLNAGTFFNLADEMTKLAEK